MTTVNMLEAKTTLSKLVDAVETGSEKEIIIARNGKPAARLVAIAAEKPRIKIGHFDGIHEIGPFDPEVEAEVAALFGLDE